MPVVGQERTNAGLELIAIVDDGRARAEQWMRHRRPDGIWTEEEVGVPVTQLVFGKVGYQPVTGDVLAVPEVDHSSVGQPARIPLGARVPVELVGPESIDGQSDMRMSLQDVVLHPTGARGTDRSGGREDQDEAGLAAIIIEPSLELVNAGEIGESHAARRVVVRHEKLVTGREGSNHQQDGQDRDPVSTPLHARHC